MPIRYDIHHNRKLVYATLNGVLTETDMFTYQRTVWSRPDVVGYNELVDATGVTQFESVSADKVHQLANLSASMDTPPHPSRLAIVASTDAQFGMARMYQIYRELETKGTRTIQVFRSCDEALKWLGVGVA